MQLQLPAHASSGKFGPPAPRPVSAAMPSAHTHCVRVPASVGRLGLPQGTQLSRAQDSATLAIVSISHQGDSSPQEANTQIILELRLKFNITQRMHGNKAWPGQFF